MPRQLGGLLAWLDALDDRLFARFPALLTALLAGADRIERLLRAGAARYRALDDLAYDRVVRAGVAALAPRLARLAGRYRALDDLAYDRIVRPAVDALAP
ncbi:MAG: hypothetical protein ACRDUY_02965, partial [Nitriliruptorales bacterium]